MHFSVFDDEFYSNLAAGAESDVSSEMSDADPTALAGTMDASQIFHLFSVCQFLHVLSMYDRHSIHILYAMSFYVFDK